MYWQAKKANAVKHFGHPVEHIPSVEEWHSPRDPLTPIRILTFQSTIAKIKVKDQVAKREGICCILL